MTADPQKIVPAQNAPEDELESLDDEDELDSELDDESELDEELDEELELLDELDELLLLALDDELELLSDELLLLDDDELDELEELLLDEELSGHGIASTVSVGGQMMSSPPTSQLLTC